MNALPTDREALRAMFAEPADGRFGRSKVMPLDDAIRAHVEPGMLLHFAYSEGRPMAASNALVRVFAGRDPGFTIVSAGLVANQASLVTERIAKRLIVSFVGENYPTPGPNRLFQKAIDSGDVEVENHSLLVLSQRLAAGAYGFPFAPTRSWGGSSLADNECYAEIDDPFGTGQKIGVVKPLIPDVTFVHGLAADTEGNIILSPPFGEGDISAFAASKGVVATVERIVSPDVVRRHAHLVKIPAYRVLSVSEAPFGCHPYAIYAPEGLGVPAYVEDFHAFAQIRAASKTPELFDEWVRDWILGVDSHEDYVAKLGVDRLDALRGRAPSDAWMDDVAPATLKRLSGIEGYDSRELMVVEAARAVEAKVRDEGRTIVEAGVGLANLAAWLAVAKLQHEEGIPAELVAEIGLYGYLPKAGEPFIFSNRNLPTCKSMTGVEAVLGLYVSGRHNNCIAIIGAGQIDSAGNINSTQTGDGRFLLGSGGANDITSGAADTIAVTQQSRHRLVDTLPYVTSPGKNVSTLVTDLGVYEKEAGRFALTRYFPLPDQSRDETVAHIRSQCGWDLVVSERLRAAEPPRREDLLKLRLYDIRNDFLDYSAEREQGAAR
ncbi:glutaconate CoA-transferase [Nitratireductor mangrovi]|uniref:Glutaconate CoA-transferase n=1 Tax=Nitratireductor mangrovi TaxID=2599600 RepID=A0A5B8KTM5_9HYPH|nr:CoA-transferase [Nitratireductor mangrovi]QDY98964.1 glutaconate CoA-transferase [Nitratireductor mangrovi]